MREVTILDGGTGRQLQRIGAPFRQPEWSALALIEGPQFVSQVHADFIAAGAQGITTNSYALVPFHLGAERHAASAAALADLAGRLAREAVQGAASPVLVGGSLPPVCGSYRPDLFELAAARPLLEVLVKALRPYVDHWQGETLSAIAEAELLRSVVGDDGKPVWISFTLADDATRGPVPTLRSGETVEDAVLAAVRLGASVVLFNCSQPEVMGAAVDVAVATLAKAGVFAQSSKEAGVRIGVYANAFPPMSADAAANEGLSDIRADLDPAGYLDWARDWVRRGASLVGGCCGIGPEHIAELRRAFPAA
ncbi:MAG: hypothetical protein RJB26_1663 [Pseudomonadota bacterium]|jgi:S-methylmethionine-dependent homocysteine/selenocysteine methylase